MTDTGAKIRPLRKKLGLTQAQLGELLFLAQSTVSEMERGVQAPTIRNKFALEQIAREKNVPLPRGWGRRVIPCRTKPRPAKK